jgi:cholinesterase
LVLLIHTQICFVFNIDPSVSVNNTNWIGPYPAFYALSKLISRSWISFVHDLDPNHHGIPAVPAWPEYSRSKSNFVFRVDNSTVEDDTWRTDELAFWGGIFGQLKT